MADVRLKNGVNEKRRTHTLTRVSEQIRIRERQMITSRIEKLNAYDASCDEQLKDYPIIER